MLKFNKKQYKTLLGIGILVIIGAIIFGSQFGQTKTRKIDTETNGVDLAVEALDFESLPKEPLTKEEVIENHRLIAENEKYGLYLLEERVSILLKNKETGNLIYSTVQQEDESITSATWKTFVQSGIVMEYIKGTNVVPEQADMILQEPEIQIGYEENGFVARIFYPALSIGFDVSVHLLESGLQVEVPEESIVESSDEFKLGSLYVFPFLGYSTPGMHEGYMFIPDGTGALIHLEENNKKFSQPYREKVYGANVGIDDAYVLSLFFDMFDPVNESENIIAPVFGMVHSDVEQAVFAMIESGQASATIQAYPNGAVTRYDWIAASFVYRQVYNQLTSQSTGSMAVRQKERNHFDISIHYALLSGEQADYVNMATYYRDRLLEKGDLIVQDTSYQMKLDFFGGDQENWLIFKKMIAMTTTEQLEEILNKLNQQGVRDILAIYNGWQKDGVYGGLPTTSYEVDKKIGGKEGMENLLETARKLGTDLYLYINPLLANPDTHYNITADSVKKLNKRVYTETMYRQVYRDFHYLLPESTVEFLEKNVNSFLDADMKNLAVDGISNTIFSYLHDNQIYDRQHTINYYNAVFDSLEEDFQLILPEPFAPYWKYTKAISNMPTESSKYVFTDEEVPFLPIVLNGVLPMYSDYSNFQANQTLYRLQLIEQGIYPSFLLTYEEPAELINTNSSDIYSSKFEYYEEKIVEYDREMKELALLRNGAMIVDYEKDKGVSKVSYTNGLVIYVNFNEEEAIIDGITLEGHSYKVGGQ